MINRLYDDLRPDEVAQLARIGFGPTNHRLHVYSNGTIAETVWDIALLLQLSRLIVQAKRHSMNKKPAKQRHFAALSRDFLCLEKAMKSARGDHNAAKQAEANETIVFLRKKYRSFVEVPFRRSLKDMIRYLRDVEPKETMDPTEHPHWNLLLEWHGHCLSTYEKALAHLESES